MNTNAMQNWNSENLNGYKLSKHWFPKCNWLVLLSLLKKGANDVLELLLNVGSTDLNGRAYEKI